MAIIDHALREKLPRLAVEFFIVFSRFECAMKRSGAYARGDETKVEPDWDKLARDLGPDFLRSTIATGVAQVLIDTPPKKQVRQSDGQLGWREMGPVNTTEGLFLAVRRARNNLLHGGKYRDDRDGRYSEIDGSERSDVLLRQSLAILELALEAKPEIRQEF